MTTLAEARAELAQIAERKAALQKIVDAAPKSLLVASKVRMHSIGATMKQDYVEDSQTEQAYADALDTLLMLRHQPGTEAAVEGHCLQWVIAPDCGKVAAEYWSNPSYKLRNISPCFSSDDAANAAIDTIGADRILRMFRTLHGVA